MIFIIHEPCGSLFTFSGEVARAIVRLGDGAGSRGVQVRYRFHRFNRTECLAGGKFRADLRQLDEDDIAQLLLRVIGDSDRTGSSIHLNPFVLFRIFAI